MLLPVVFSITYNHFQFWLKFLQDLIKDGYNVKSPLFDRIKGGREGILQRLAQELVALKRDEEFETITTGINGINCFNISFLLV